MTQTKKPFQRRDATGHINPEYAKSLLDKARETHNPDNDPEGTHAFLARSRTGDSLAEELGEAFIESATSGEDAEPGRHEELTQEELGGPFVVTGASEEFADGTDESNIAEATREPLPRTSRAQP